MSNAVLYSVNRSVEKKKKKIWACR